MDVTMPDGTIITNVPAGTTQKQLMARYSKVRPPFPVQTTAEMGPVTGRLPIPGAGAAQAAAQAQEIEGEIPAFRRFEMSAAEHAPLLLGGTAALTVPGAGLGALALSSGMGGLFAGGGELARQRMAGEDLDFGAAVDEGTGVAAGGMIAGGSLKLLGKLAAKLFYSPLTPAAQRASRFAAEEDVPFPLSSATPASGAGRTQTASGVLLPAAIRNASDAQRVAQYLNQRVGTFTEKAPVFDDAALRGQEFLRSVFEPGEKASRQVFKDYAAQVGKDAEIPYSSTKSVIRSVVDDLRIRGETRGPLYRRLKSMGDPKGPGFKNQTLTTQEMDDLLRGVIDDTFVPGTKWAEEGKRVIDALVKDLDTYSTETYGYTFADKWAKATGLRAEFRELRDIPGLAALSREFGKGGAKKGSIDWMNSLFREENGKALAKLRELNPDLYHDLADAWLAKQIDGFSRMSSDTMVRSLDGRAMRAWFVQNRAKITQIFGKQQATVLDNFTEYAELMGSAVTKANKGLGDPTAMWGRAAAEGWGAVKAPMLMIPTEGGAFLLARGLSDPSSQVFKLFTQGVSPAWRSFTVKSGQLAGQAGGSESR